jgi:ComF family protein
MIGGIGPGDVLCALGDIVMPRKCIVCGRPLSLRERHLCIGCLADLPRTFFSGQRHNQMADRFNDLVQRDLDEGLAEGLHSQGLASCRREEYAMAAALFYYRSATGYRKITQRLKYHADLSAGRYFSRLLGKEMVEGGLFKDVDAVVPVPLHWTRRWSRGYNQAEVIAATLAGILGAPLYRNMLSRRRRTRTQTRMSVERKSRNVEGAFKAHVPDRVFRHILLVDDVFTTGATLHECFKALRAVLPSEVRISVATLAAVGQ